MKYFRRAKDEESRTEITYDEALNILLGTWKDSDMTRDMLTIPNNIECTFSNVYVQSDDGIVCMAGLWNMIPDIEYDEDGNHRG